MHLEGSIAATSAAEPAAALLLVVAEFLLPPSLAPVWRALCTVVAAPERALELTELGDVSAAEAAFDSAVHTRLLLADELAARLRWPFLLEQSTDTLRAEPLLVHPLLPGPLLETSGLLSLVRPSSCSAEVRRGTPFWRPGKLSAPSSARWKSRRALPGRDRPLGGCGNDRAPAPAAPAARGEAAGDTAALGGRGIWRVGSGEMLGTRLGDVWGRAGWKGPPQVGDSGYSRRPGVPGVGGRGSREGIIARMRGDVGCEEAELGRGIREGDSPRGVAGRLSDFRGVLGC